MSNDPHSGELRLRRVTNGLILQTARESARLSLDQCAAWLGLNPADVAAWERGEHDIPVAALRTLVGRLGIALSEFDDEPPVATNGDSNGQLPARLRDARLAAARPVPELAAVAGLEPEEWEAVEAGEHPIGAAALGAVARRLDRSLSQLAAPGNDSGHTERILSHLEPGLAAWVADPSNAVLLATARQLAALPPDDLLRLSRLLASLATRQESA